MTELRLDPRAVIADLDELASGSGGRFAGAKRLAWTPQWLEARSWLRLEARRHRSRAATATRPATCGRASTARTERLHDRRLAHRRRTRRRLARRRAWPDDRARDRPAAGREPAPSRRSACGSSTGRTRRARGSAAASLGSSACAGTLEPDEVRDLRDAEGVTLADALAACGVDLDHAPAAAERLEGAVALSRAPHRAGPRAARRRSARPAP